MAPTEYSLKESYGSPEPHIDQNDEEVEENILCSSELGSSHSLNYHHQNSVISVIENNNYNNQGNLLGGIVNWSGAPRSVVQRTYRHLDI